MCIFVLTTGEVNFCKVQTALDAIETWGNTILRVAAMKKSFTAQAALLLCEMHQNEEMDLYCKQCKVPICSDCVRSNHNGHEFETIAKWSRKLINNRDGFLRDLRSAFARKKKSKNRIVRETKCRNENSLKRKMSCLEKKREEMHQAVDKLIDEQKEKCKSYSDKLSRDVQNLERKIKEGEDEIMKMLNTFEKTTTKGLDIIEYYEKLCLRLHSFEFQGSIEHRDRQLYNEGDIHEEQLLKMIGTVSESLSVPKIIEHAHSFTHKDIKVNTIRPLSRFNAWITYEGEREFALMDKNGKCLQTVKKNTENHTFCVVKENSLIHIDFYKQIVMKIDHSRKTSVIMNTAPLHPFHVGEALDGNILVTLVDEFSFNRTAQSQRKAQMVTPGGQVLHTYEFGEDGSIPVFTLPCRPIQNYNSNVCILDYYEVDDDNRRGKVHVFYEDGELKFSYDGHGTQFRPLDIYCDSLCNIICINAMDSSVHIIDSEGVFLAYLLTSDTCIADPYSLGLHSDSLWVGSGKGEVAVYRYKY